MTKGVTIELTDVQIAHLGDLARREHRSVEFVVSRMLQDRVEHADWFAAAVQLGVEAADQSDLAAHADVVSEMKALLDDNRNTNG